MGNMCISAQDASLWRGYAAQTQTPAPQSQAAPDQSSQIRSGQSLSSSGKDQYLSISEMIRQAREKADKAKDSLRIPKNSARYGDSVMMAYSRLARAKNKSQVSSATGYARRQIAQLKAAIRQDPENADRIRAAINQLQKAVSRGNRKKKDLDREKLMDSQRARAQREDNLRKAQHLKHELNRRRAMRAIREDGYLREADIDNKLQDQLSATRMELRAQAQSLASAIAPNIQTANQQYAVQAAAAAPPAAAGAEIDLQA